MTTKKKIRLVEVGPRDGLQNEKTIIATQDKFTFIELLIQAGLRSIETTSFVRAEKIPQMSDGADLAVLLRSYLEEKNLELFALVPNLIGLDKAIDSKLKHVAVFTATSEAFNQKNINATINESLDRIRPVVTKANQNGLKTRGYISTVFGCPYEGTTSLDKMLYLVDELKKLNCMEISLGDTIGVGHPDQVVEVVNRLKCHHDLNYFSMHFHDTRGTALANILASLQEGITSFDVSAAGLGGCPYAVGSSGNVATEDVLYMLHAMGYETGVDFDKLFMASRFILQTLGIESTSKMHRAYASTCKN